MTGRALANGLILSIMILNFGGISGAHFNPAGTRVIFSKISSETNLCVSIVIILLAISVSMGEIAILLGCSTRRRNCWYEYLNYYSNGLILCDPGAAIIRGLFPDNPEVIYYRIWLVIKFFLCLRRMIITVDLWRTTDGLQASTSKYY